MIQRHRGSTITLGDGLILRSWPRSNPLVPHQPVVLATRTRSATIEVGEQCGLTGTVIVAANRVTIGNRVLVGANVTIADTDFHPIHPDRRKEDINAGKTASISIEDDVFIGMNSLILKGVHIGKESVVGAGSVVVRDVPFRSIAAGNPASVISRING
jgi:acetyltransferase-like isoleucine patch superfamily enzyme